MKRATITLLILLACALSAYSQTYTRLGATQQVLTPDNKPDTSAYITVFKVVYAGQIVSLSPKTYNTDSSGYFIGDDGQRGIRLRTNAQVWIYSPITIVPGISRNPLAGTQYTVPAASATQLEELIYTFSIYGTKGEIVVANASGRPADFGPCVNGEVLQWDSTQTLGVKCATVQASDADLTAIAALTPNNDDIIQRKAGAWTNRTVAQFKTDLGLSTIASSGLVTTVTGDLVVTQVAQAASRLEAGSGVTGLSNRQISLNHSTEAAQSFQVGGVEKWILAADSTGAFVWTQGGIGTRMAIVSSGNVGIGTTGPDRKLDVLDAASPQLRLTHTDGSAYTDLQSNASGNLTITPSGGTTTITNAIQADQSSTADDTRFLLWDVTAGALKRVTRGAADSCGSGFRCLRIAN